MSRPSGGPQRPPALGAGEVRDDALDGPRGRALSPDVGRVRLGVESAVGVGLVLTPPMAGGGRGGNRLKVL